MKKLLAFAVAAAASQSYAAPVVIDLVSLTSTGGVVTSLASHSAGTGDFTVTGTGIGDATLVSGSWGGLNYVSTIELNTNFGATYTITDQRVNYSSPTTADPAAIVNNSPVYQNATCSSLGGGGFLICPNLPQGTDVLGALNADNGQDLPETITIEFTSFVSTSNFAGTITMFNSFNANGVAGTNTTVYEFSAVPVPAAAWLFGSALVGLAGVARRRTAA